MARASMELWSNESYSEFAIKFRSKIVAKTSENPNLVNVLDKVPYKDGFEVDWHYTLSQWVVYYLSNKYVALFISKSKERELKTEESKDNSQLFAYVHDIKPKLEKKITPKRGLKCHYCNLKYCLEEERKDHEKFWHPHELIKR